MLIGLDVGSKRIGVAKSDEAGLLAHGVGFIARGKDDTRAIEEILALVHQFRAETIIVGHPLNMNGTKGPQALVVEQFAEKLTGRFDGALLFWDERLSSKEAETYLMAGDVSRSKRKKQVDKLSAQIILQSYMDAHKTDR